MLSPVSNKVRNSKDNLCRWFLFTAGLWITGEWKSTTGIERFVFSFLCQSTSSPILLFLSNWSQHLLLYFRPYWLAKLPKQLLNWFLYINPLLSFPNPILFWTILQVFATINIKWFHNVTTYPLIPLRTCITFIFSPISKLKSIHVDEGMSKWLQHTSLMNGQLVLRKVQVSKYSIQL